MSSSLIDLRYVVSAFFKHLRLMAWVFGGILGLTVLYLALTPRDYESAARLMVTFNDARPASKTDELAGAGLSAEVRREIIQSNIGILASRDLAQALLQNIGIARVYPALAANPPSRGTLMDAALKKIEKDIKIANEGGTAIISLRLFNRDPQLAQEMLARLIDLYIARQSQIYGGSPAAALQDLAADALRALEEAQRRLYDYKAKTGVAAIDEEMNLLLNQRNDIARYLTLHHLPLPSTEQQARRDLTQQEAAPDTRRAIADGERFRMLDDMQKSLDELHAREAELRQTYRNDSAVMRNLRQNMSAVQEKQQQAIAALTRQLGHLDRQIAALDANRAPLNDLVRDVEMKEAGYKAAATRASEAAASRSLSERKITPIAVIDGASLPYKPSRPARAVTLLLAFCAALALAFFAALMAEYFDQTLRLPEQATALLGLPVLAGLAQGQAPAPTSLVALQQSLNGMMGGADKNTLVLLLASSHAGEGIAEIGRALARHGGWKTVFVNAPAELDKIQPPAGAGENQLIILDGSDLVKNPARLEWAALADVVVFVAEAERTRLPVIRESLRQLRERTSRILGMALYNRRYHIPAWVYARLWLA